HRARRHPRAARARGPGRLLLLLRPVRLRPLPVGHAARVAHVPGVPGRGGRRGPAYGGGGGGGGGAPPPPRRGHGRGGASTPPPPPPASPGVGAESPRGTKPATRPTPAASSALTSCLSRARPDPTDNSPASVTPGGRAAAILAAPLPHSATSRRHRLC